MPEENKKEDRIKKIALSYYSRQDIRKAMFDFSKNRECIPRYFEGFGKRPDAFHYDSDIPEYVKKGATSFHCSQELWQDPLQISTEMSEEAIKKLRIGWDLLIDIDAKYFDYAKIYAEAIIDILKEHRIKDIGVKFSGSKGWHIIIPWKAFPEEMSGRKTSEMFPEWPRIICRYLNNKIQEKLKEKVLDIVSDANLEVYCNKCKTTAEKTEKIILLCNSCKTKMELYKEEFKRKKIIRCPSCNREMNEVRRESIYLCRSCLINSKTNPRDFRERVQSRQIEADLILVSPRHLFRMPYSLHEKTALASVVVSPDKIKDFNLKDADPLKVQARNFIPDSREGEASILLREAIEYSLTKTPEIEEQREEKKDKRFKEITIKNLTENLYPPSIKEILEGMKTDGRKRALFILLNFFKSLKISDEEIRTKIEEWNKKNYTPLKEGYTKAQLMWYSKNKTKMPPNFDKSYYRDIGIVPTEEELKAKNPVSYVIKKSFALNNKNIGIKKRKSQQI